ncbi:hypothetical protein [Streptomyces sp. NPDC086776]|uniref:hypothetical protein n=1 Tax=Streptomyces sp. NPDC086776 TaxID=3365756 RepID=UPI00380FAE53
MSVTLTKPSDADVLPVSITVEYDNYYEPHGEPDIIEWEYEQINSHKYAAYTVSVRVVGPVEREASSDGRFVELTDTGTYKDAAEIQDPYLREVAEELIAEVRGGYLDDLKRTRDEITALISRLEGI